MKLTSSVFAAVALLASSVMAAPAASSSTVKTYTAKPYLAFDSTCIKDDLMYGSRIISYTKDFKLSQGKTDKENCGSCAKLTVSGKTRYVQYAGSDGCVGCTSDEVRLDPMTLKELFPITQTEYSGIQIEIVDCGNFKVMGDGLSLNGSSK